MRSARRPQESEAGSWFSLTPALLEQLSGPGLAIPDVRAPLDLAILERMVREHPPLGSPAGWHVRFGRELNASDDRKHFTTARRGLPIVEGKHLTAFAVDTAAATLRIAPRRSRTAARPAEHVRPGAARVQGCRQRDEPYDAHRRGRASRVRDDSHPLLSADAPQHGSAAGALRALQQLPCEFPRAASGLHACLAGGDGRGAGSASARRDSLYAELLRCARIVDRGPCAPPAAADMHALAARAYGLTHEEFAHVLSSFPLVPAEERQQALESPMWTARRDSEVPDSHNDLQAPGSRPRRASGADEPWRLEPRACWFPMWSRNFSSGGQRRSSVGSQQRRHRTPDQQRKDNGRVDHEFPIALAGRTRRSTRPRALLAWPSAP